MHWALKLKAMGQNRLIIHGVEKMTGGAYQIMPDRIEAGTFLAAAAATGGKVKVTKSRPVDP